MTSWNASHPPKIGRLVKSSLPPWQFARSMCRSGISVFCIATPRPIPFSVLLLHLAWHRHLKNEGPRAAHLWIDPAAHPRRLRQVAAICRKIWRANESDVPYAFSPPSDCFDAETGKYLHGPTPHGLTCATFVLAVFEAAGLRLANYETWPVGKPGDAEWQEWVVRELESGSSPAARGHIEAVKQEIGAVRFRPEEVAGAATVTPLPADFEIASERGKEILHQLVQHAT